MSDSMTPKEVEETKALATEHPAGSWSGREVLRLIGRLEDIQKANAVNVAECNDAYKRAMQVAEERVSTVLGEKGWIVRMDDFTIIDRVHGEERARSIARGLVESLAHVGHVLYGRCGVGPGHAPSLDAQAQEFVERDIVTGFNKASGSRFVDEGATAKRLAVVLGSVRQEGEDATVRRLCEALCVGCKERWPRSHADHRLHQVPECGSLVCGAQAIRSAMGWR